MKKTKHSAAFIQIKEGLEHAIAHAQGKMTLNVREVKDRRKIAKVRTSSGKKCKKHSNRSTETRDDIRLAKSSMAMIAEVWPQEDFSDWEK